MVRRLPAHAETIPTCISHNLVNVWPGKPEQTTWRAVHLPDSPPGVTRDTGRRFLWGDVWIGR